MTGSGPGRAVVAPYAPRARAGRAASVRALAARALPGFARPRAADTYAAALRELRARHGGAPVLVRGPSGPVLVLLDPQDMRRFYAEPASALAPDPCEAAGERRRINAEVLAADAPVHPSCGPFLAAVAEEARLLTASDTLRLARARRAVARAGRRIVLGEAAAGDEELTGWLRRLRGEGDGMGPRPTRARAERAVQERATARIAQYAAYAEPHTLVGRARRSMAEPAGAVRAAAAAGPGELAAQARRWLLAMDTLPATLLRTLLLLGAHPGEQDAAAAEARAGSGGRGELPRLRACVRESLRLYPVVPDLIRVTRAATEWRGVRYPAGTSVLLPALFHQRDPEHVPAAHAFVPCRWTDRGADRDIRMAPFGHGAGRCPGDQLGLLVTAALCAEVLRGHRVAGTRPVLDPLGPLPATLDPQGIRLMLTRR
ncbi:MULTISPECIES: cytochrome P450 [unclassified Streptomyces]|uniref:cytochrome P450 n=1 Tax=unclassified Streptomyces TaxID=2593676 RepID=UPI00225326D9|nr:MULTISPECIES: cytochrome P450 [unclassified Streptomyces]MCX4529746.1 cytochrome P450 [Streptomyces sp. NBC_01551]MCX4539682.1 cytochrome P450 [Streptomyces sp. NBC_01565]